MWFTPNSSNVGSSSSARSWRIRPRAAAPKITRLLAWPVRPKIRLAIIGRLYRSYDLSVIPRAVVEGSDLLVDIHGAGARRDVSRAEGPVGGPLAGCRGCGAKSGDALLDRGPFREPAA